MLTHWNKLLNTDCKVYQIGECYVYPVFRNGSSSLERECDNILVNENIRYCDNMHVLIRDPKERFISGINEYCSQNNADLNETHRLVVEGKFIDRHFSPQWTWLFHLYKYYKGKVVLRSFDKISDYTGLHANPSEKNTTTVDVPNEYVDGDLKLSKHFDQHKDLADIIKEHVNVLS